MLKNTIIAVLAFVATAYAAVTPEKIQYDPCQPHGRPNICI